MSRNFKVSSRSRSYDVSSRSRYVRSSFQLWFSVVPNLFSSMDTLDYLWMKTVDPFIRHTRVITPKRLTERRGSSPRLSTWATHLQRNVAAVAILYPIRQVRIEPQASGSFKMKQEPLVHLFLFLIVLKWIGTGRYSAQ